MGSGNKLIKKAAIGVLDGVCWVSKKIYQGTAFTIKTTYDHRDKIIGTGVGIARGTINIAGDTLGHTIKEKDYVEQLNIIEKQSERYKELTLQLYKATSESPRFRRTLIDSLMIGAAFTGQYAFTEAVPNDVQMAYELAYPQLAQSESLIEAVNRMDDTQLQGLIAGIKGKLFELKYVDYLNNGYLPDGYSAQLAESATNPGWDIVILDDNEMISQELQLKATNSLDYVYQAIETYPHIDIVTTDEVYSHIAMQGFSEHVINSGISNQELTSVVTSSLEDTSLTFDWVPSIIPFALIAYSVSHQESLTDFQKGEQFGERSSKSYVAYLTGGAIVVATNIWWLGLITAIGSRTVLDIGHSKRKKLLELKKFVKDNEQVLKRMEVRIANF